MRSVWVVLGFVDVPGNRIQYSGQAQVFTTQAMAEAYRDATYASVEHDATVRELRVYDRMAEALAAEGIA